MQTIEQTDHHNTVVHAHDLTVALENVEPGVVVVHASGELDIRSADALRQCLDTAVRNATCLVVDLTEVTFLATAGLTCLIELSEAAARAKLPWALATDVRPVLRALEVTGCLDRMTVRPTRDAATKAVLPA
ncbi:anti-anti-sigma factor [Amycolatopsis marina]|uniref:Anti-sigma factor antagonist n=1 Tax=Amycolatopsis marina TaxID=490629 RepID=A0A1I0WSW1_9PSEU|nr:STAS domain-containing protein [Amycolatopsis marina]SFA91043.1 anti-anti-sigma factor [Amycolatopsis marina]